jgi:hypothetical protein
MIEINKRKFMDVKTFRKNDGFEAIQAVAGTILDAVARRARDRIVAQGG